MRIWKKDEPFIEYQVFQSTGTNQLMWEQRAMLLPSGMAYSDDVYEFPLIKSTPDQENILKYYCKRCGSKLLVNKEKLPAVQVLNCLACGSSDLEEIK